jgi:hypothetical protein
MSSNLSEEQGAQLRKAMEAIAFRPTLLPRCSHVPGEWNHDRESGTRWRISAVDDIGRATIEVIPLGWPEAFVTHVRIGCGGKVP